MQESGRLAQCDVLLPPDLREEGLCRLLCTHVQQVLVHIQRQLLPGLGITRHRRVLGLAVHPQAAVLPTRMFFSVLFTRWSTIATVERDWVGVLSNCLHLQVQYWQRSGLQTCNSPIVVGQCWQLCANRRCFRCGFVRVSRYLKTLYPRTCRSLGAEFNN